MKRTQESFRGCLLAGAAGDALGYPVEFLSLEQIREKFGEAGVNDLVIQDSSQAQITDDTQMTLFTAEGILRAHCRQERKGICHPPSVVFFAYQRWLLTQGYPRVSEYEWAYDGWLLSIKDLYARRTPGETCLTSLRSRRQGTIDQPLNNSKGCGGVMRVAPAGLFYQKDEAFSRAAEFAALTHGHPSGYLAAGALAYLVACLIEGEDLEKAVRLSLLKLYNYRGHEECTHTLKLALQLSRISLEENRAIAQIGEGWIAEEALGIAVYCALKHPADIRKALLTAVNHDGDSDSTGAITGNILGAYLGLSAIPREWQDIIELVPVVCQIADDLLTGHLDSESWWRRYPGY